ncbi:MAG: maleylpyruvate isomerase N-terminal domain-containing protein [Pirellulales bacterium]|nr:maleylpyruvate isomerase N-terminal domain-containing protein [Pirellulales bacterium]
MLSQVAPDGGAVDWTDGGIEVLVFHGPPPAPVEATPTGDRTNSKLNRSINPRQRSRRIIVYHAAAMATTAPISVNHLFPEISQRLVALLRSLGSAEWHLPTLSSRRCVKDVAAHLLDGSLRRLSLQRDDYLPSKGSGEPRPGETLLDFLTRLNGEWETAARRLSPQVLCALIEWADEELARFFPTLDPNGKAQFSVAWTGESVSLNWMDLAREYTEKWHHTQQVFEATARPSTIAERRLFYPCLDVFMRALPYTFRHVTAPQGSTVAVKITGEAGGAWSVTRIGASWLLAAGESVSPTARFTIDQNDAWKLFTKRLDRAEAIRRFPSIRIEGDGVLGSQVIDMVAVMA